MTDPAERATLTALRDRLRAMRGPLDAEVNNRMAEFKARRAWGSRAWQTMTTHRTRELETYVDALERL